jgi:hypothetical protein
LGRHRFVHARGVDRHEGRWFLYWSIVANLMNLVKRTAAVPKGAMCFGCNQSFEGNPVGVQFETDLLPATASGELRGLYFHPGHLLHYARRREWHELASFIVEHGPPNY